jgi:Ni,Fe-hydrogenase I cytochrome b subunit
MNLSFNQKRIGVGVFLALVLFSVINHFAGLGAFGRFSEEAMVAIFVLMFIWLVRVGPTLEEIQVHRQNMENETFKSTRARQWIRAATLVILMFTVLLIGPIAQLARGEAMQREGWIQLIVVGTMVVVAAILGWRMKRP